jgi:hypothetical protein
LVLENHLTLWHYSGIKCPLDTSLLNFQVIESCLCLKQLYADRVIEYKRTALAAHPSMVKSIKASLGLFAGIYWKDFEQQLISENEQD